MKYEFMKISIAQLYYFLLLVLLFILASCSPNQIRYQQQQVSRDYTYIEFTENIRPLTIIDEVGGEQMNFYKVLAFQGDQFDVKVVPLEGVPASSISGVGFRTKEIPGKNLPHWIIEVEALESIFTIDLSAHPYSRYQLYIEKL